MIADAEEMSTFLLKRYPAWITSDERAAETAPGGDRLNGQRPVLTHMQRDERKQQISHREFQLLGWQLSALLGCFLLCHPFPDNRIKEPQQKSWAAPEAAKEESWFPALILRNDAKDCSRDEGNKNSWP